MKIALQNCSFPSDDRPLRALSCRRFTLHLSTVPLVSCESWVLTVALDFFWGDQRSGMENVLNVSNSDTASWVAVSAQGSGDCGPLNGVEGKKRCRHFHEGKKNSIWLPPQCFYMCVTVKAAPVHLSVAPCCITVLSPLSGDWYVDRHSHLLFKYYCKPPLNRQQCGNICLIPHPHDFLHSPVYNLWKNRNS